MARRIRRHAWAALALALAAAGTRGGDADPAAVPADDEEFVRALESGRPGAVDRRRLAKLVFGAAVALDGGRVPARLLANVLVVRDESQRAGVEEMVRGQFAALDRAVERFRGSASALIDEATSVAHLHDALTDGGESCWRLDAYVRLVETYGARPADLVALVPAAEACARLRRAAYRPSVRALVADALQDGAASRAEVEALREELRELERLLEDLRGVE